MIVSSGETKIFEKKLKKGVTKQGGNCDSQWWEMMFFGIFSESSNTTGCRFGYNLGSRLCFFGEKLKTGATKWGGNLDSQW